MTNGSPPRPRFSIVSAVYDVAPYLPEFIASIDRQRFDGSRVEIIVVDDGSTDGSLAILRDWAKRSDGQVQVLSQPNGGQASARNLGLEHATGEWVTFPDPDDLLDRDYLRAADAFATAHPDVEVLSARPVILDEAAGSGRRPHPRSWQYARGIRTANLAAEPSVFLGVAAGAFFRLDRLREANIRYDTRIRPNFEDGHLAARYLLSLPEPVIGLLADSVYVYRKRAAGDSSMQGSMAKPGRFGEVLELGYLDLMDRARQPDGTVAAWVQQLVVYELSWYLSADDRISTTIRLPAALAPRFHGLLDRILRELDPEVVERHRSRPLRPEWMDLLAHAARPTDWHSPVVVTTRQDRTMRLRRFQYRFVGRQPSETIRAGGTVVQPAFAKTMAHRYFERDFLWERILWLPDDPNLRLELDGEPMPVSRSARDANEGPAARSRSASARMVRRVRRVLRAAAALPLRMAARGWPYRSRFRNAWVLMDRIHDADDNGERLFEHLRANRPDVNAWFVVERGTRDWERLRARDERRLVAHGSWTWKMLMLNAAWLLASHIDRAITRPPAMLRITSEPRWRFGFLQHGVIKDDLSRWLNATEVELAVVSTEPELASVIGDGTAYRWTAKETRLTGLPRFDRLLAKGTAVPEEKRDLVLVAPTWRQWLTLPLASGSQRRALDSKFWESEYVREWLGFLASPAIASAVAAAGKRLAFMPHPNLQSILPQLELPGHVEPVSFAGVDVQDLYARCALLVTDYSSVAFNLAYIDRPVVYFQFDRAAMLGGLHVGRRGYFDYERDGFGPVAETLASAELAIVEAISNGPRPAPAYQRRVAATFPVRDGGACARVVAAIEEMSRPWSPATERPISSAGNR